MRLKTVLTTIFVALMLVVATDYVATATTGHPLILGHKNKATKITKLIRTTPGPALKLKTTSSANPPFVTNGHGKVGNLNADLLDGLDSSAFAQSSDATRAYAAFDGDGSINPSDSQGPVGGVSHGLTQANETAHTVTGTYCFHPSFAPKSAMVSALGDLGIASTYFTVATVTIRTNHGLSFCGTNDTVRVRTYSIPPDPGSPALSDQPFILWLK